MVPIPQSLSPRSYRRDAWIAFWLSLVVPGAGQLWAKRWTCLVYFAIVAGLSALPISFRIPAFLLLGVVSAENARRVLEIDRLTRPGKRVEVRSRVHDRSGRGSGVNVLIEIEVARPIEELWTMLADFPRFVTIDPLHTRIVVQATELKPGVELTIEHVVFGLTFLRHGKLLTWRDGRGYSFSDLSVKGALGIFPHVFDFAIEPIDGAGSRLTVSVRGKWTTRWFPRWLGLRWIGYVSREHARMLREPCLETKQEVSRWTIIANHATASAAGLTLARIRSTIPQSSRTNAPAAA